MQLYLVRHPRPRVAAGLCYGWTDLPLAEDQDAVADRLHRQIPTDIPCYASPLQRCRLLAEALHARPRFDERLREMNFGQWEMQAWEGIPRHELDAWAADPLGFMPPGGESVAQVGCRLTAFLREKRQTPALLLVTHGGIMKMLSGLVLNEPAAVWQSRRFDYGGLLSLTLDTARLEGDGPSLWHNAAHG